jgi:hypothetical protein
MRAVLILATPSVALLGLLILAGLARCSNA